MPIQTGQLLTARQVAERLNLRVVTVYAAAADGRLPSVRLWEGNRRALVRFRAQDIERLIKERIVTENHDDK